jgi:hypothetical protein
MPKARVVRDGDCIASLGHAEGFHPDTIWNHADNAELRGERESGYVLVPGDVIAIPDLVERKERCTTTRRHVFRRLGVPEKLRLRLLDVDEPRANVDYVLEIGDQKQTGKTDREGRIQAWIPPSARRGRLVVGRDPPIDLDLGALQPSSSDVGLRARLKNLGFIDEEDVDDDHLRSRIALFQRRHGLEATGEADDATRRKLTEVHGS